MFNFPEKVKAQIEQKHFRFLSDGIQYRYEFKNGYELSAIIRQHSYGGEVGFFEVGWWNSSDKTLERDITVEGWLTHNEVVKIAKKLAKKGGVK